MCLSASNKHITCYSLRSNIVKSLLKDINKAKRMYVPTKSNTLLNRVPNSRQVEKWAICHFYESTHVILSDFPCAYCLIIVLKQSVKHTYGRENQTHSKCEFVEDIDLSQCCSLI